MLNILPYTAYLKTEWGRWSWKKMPSIYNRFLSQIANKYFGIKQKMLNFDEKSIWYRIIECHQRTYNQSLLLKQHILLIPVIVIFSVRDLLKSNTYDYALPSWPSKWLSLGFHRSPGKSIVHYLHFEHLRAPGKIHSP